MTRPQQPTATPYAALGKHLRKLREKAGLNQRQLTGVSRRTVQDVESGRRAPTPAVLTRYLDACAAGALERNTADLLVGEGRCAQRGRRYGLHAPDPVAIRTEGDLRAALACAYETTGGYRPVRDFSRFVPPDGDPISPSSASRIHRCRALPSTAGQLETWLALCRVRGRELRYYREAYADITTYRGPRFVPARHHRAAAARPALVVAEGEQESVELTGLAAAVARQLPAATLEQILLTGVTRLAGAQARRNGGGTYMPDLWVTTPAGRGAAPEFLIVEAKWQHGPGTPTPPVPPAPSPAGPGPSPGRHPGGRLPRAPRRQPHAAAAPRAPAA